MALAALSLPVRAALAEQVVLKANLQATISNPLYGWSLARLKEEVERQSEAVQGRARDRDCREAVS